MYLAILVIYCHLLNILRKTATKSNQIEHIYWGLFLQLCVIIFLSVSLFRLSAGCRWRPSASACPRSTLPSLSSCRRGQRRAHTHKSWEITLTWVRRHAVDCLVVRLRPHSKRCFMYHPRSALYCLCFTPPKKQEPGLIIYLPCLSYFASACDFCEIKLKCLHFYLLILDEPKIIKFSTITQAVTEECNEIIQVIIGGKKFSH